MNAIIEQLGWILIHSLWQFTLIAVLFLALRSITRLSQSRYWLGLAALGLVFACPIATYWSMERSIDPSSNRVESLATMADSQSQANFQTTQDEGVKGWSETNSPDDLSKATLDRSQLPFLEPSSLSATASIVESNQSIKSLVRPWLFTIVWGWGIGVFMLSARPLLGWHYVRRLRRTGLKTVPPLLNSRMQRLASQMRISKPVQIFESSLVLVPMVVGYLKPLILIPASSMTNLSATELDSIIRHELAHVRRHDALINGLQTLLETLLFYHPAVWWLSKQVRIERENCCDDLAVRDSDEAILLARALVRLEECRPSSLGTLSSNGGSLSHRVARLLQVDDSNVNKRSGLAISMASLVVVGIVLSASLVTMAESSNEPDEEFNVVVVQSYSDTFDWSRFRVVDADQIRALLTQFPEVGKAKRGAKPAGYVIDAQLVFKGKNNKSLTVGFSLFEKLWHEGTGEGDWKIRDPEGLKKLLNRLAIENASTLDAEGIAWGPTNQNGMTIGVKLEPQKTKYFAGENVQPNFYFRNDSDKPIANLTIPRMVQAVGTNYTALSAGGE